MAQKRLFGKIGVLQREASMDHARASRFHSRYLRTPCPSSTFVVFKFKSVSNTSLLTAGSPTFHPTGTGVARVLHPILERVLGLVLGLLLLERAESANSFWTRVCTVSSPGCTPRSDSCSCACSGVRGSLGECRSCCEFATCSDVSWLGASPAVFT